MKLLSFGEILWDIVNSKEFLGGAPFNLAAHAAMCGEQCAVISCLGKDQRGVKALKEAQKMRIDCRYVLEHSIYPTGTVNAVISKSGQPEYVIHGPVAYDFIELSDSKIDEIVEYKFDVFCFGTLAQRNETSRQSLMRLLERLDKSVTRIFCDVNLRQNFYSPDILKESLNACDILKLNDEEVATLAQLLFDNPQMIVHDFCEKISCEMGIEEIVVTMGEKGAAIFNRDGFETIQGHKVEVADTIGTGDAFSAIFLYKRLTGSRSFDAAMTANRVGAFVASQRGAIPQYILGPQRSIRDIKGATVRKIEERVNKKRGYE